MFLTVRKCCWVSCRAPHGSSLIFLFRTKCFPQSFIGLHDMKQVISWLPNTVITYFVVRHQASRKGWTRRSLIMVKLYQTIIAWASQRRAATKSRASCVSSSHFMWQKSLGKWCSVRDWETWAGEIPILLRWLKQLTTQVKTKGWVKEFWRCVNCKKKMETVASSYISTGFGSSSCGLWRNLPGTAKNRSGAGQGVGVRSWTVFGWSVWRKIGTDWQMWLRDIKLLSCKWSAHGKSKCSFLWNIVHTPRWNHHNHVFGPNWIAQIGGFCWYRQRDTQILTGRDVINFHGVSASVGRSVEDVGFAHGESSFCWMILQHEGAQEHRKTDDGLFLAFEVHLETHCLINEREPSINQKTHTIRTLGGWKFKLWTSPEVPVAVPARVILFYSRQGWRWTEFSLQNHLSQTSWCISGPQHFGDADTMVSIWTLSPQKRGRGRSHKGDSVLVLSMAMLKPCSSGLFWLFCLIFIGFGDSSHNAISFQTPVDIWWMVAR